jgi:DNA polymerase I
MIYFIGPDSAVPYTHCQTCKIEDVVRYCSSKKYLGVDTETEGLDFLTKKMIMFQIGDQEHQFVIDTRAISIEPLRAILEDSDIIKILHNSKFDYKMIKRWAGIELEGIWDTMLAEQVIHCGKQNPGYSLLALCDRYLGITLNKEPRNKFVGLEGRPFDETQIVYGAKDTEYLIEIRRKQDITIITKGLVNTIDLENKAALAFADIEYNGIPIDQDKWREISKDSGKQAVILEKELDNEILTNPKLKRFLSKYIQVELFTPIKELRRVDVNWSSPMQALAVLKTFVPSLENVNGKELYKYRYKYPFIGKYIDYKEKMKLSTSYGEGFLDNVRIDGAIHTSFNQILNTGRVASNSPNMQQIPANNKFRNCFAPSDEDYVFVSADYSSQELCIIAEGSKDPVWRDVLEKGQDLHSVCADLVYGDEWITSAEDGCAYLSNKEKCNCPKHKTLRTNVKTINFGLAYGMGPHKLSWTLNITQTEATDLIDKYFEAFPSIGKFLESLGNYGKNHGFIKTYAPVRRIRHFDNWSPMLIKDMDGDSFKILGSIERASKNTPIQGTGADMTKLAMVNIREFIKQNDVPVKMVMTVHDQIDTLCHKDYADEWSSKMSELMEAAATVILPSGLLKAEANISNQWEK